MPVPSPRISALRFIIDIASLVFLAVLAVIAALTVPPTEEARHLTPQLLVVAVLYVGARGIMGRFLRGFVADAFHLLILMALFSFLFRTSTLLQQALGQGWHDDTLIGFDTKFLGQEGSVWLQRFTHPALTEWMMFAYVIYIPLIPGLALACRRWAGEEGMYVYLVNFALVNVTCYLGFILFPVETPMWHHPGEFTSPLAGGIFTWCGEWVRTHLHEKGGGFPSPHCAMGTVMVLMIGRYRRTLLPVALPIVLTLYVSTVYCRYHYFLDSAAGIFVGIAVVGLTPVFTIAAERRALPGTARIALAVRRLTRTAQSEEDSP